MMKDWIQSRDAHGSKCQPAIRDLLKVEPNQTGLVQLLVLWNLFVSSPEDRPNF